MRSKWAVICIIAIALIATVTLVNLLVRAGLASEANSSLRHAADSVSRTIVVNDGGLAVSAQTGATPELGPQVWVFAAGQSLFGPTVHPDIVAAVKALDSVPAQFVNVPGYEYRLYGVPIYEPVGAKRLGTVVAGLSTAAFNSAQRVTLISTGAIGGLFLLILIGLAAYWVLSGRESRQESTLSLHGWNAGC